MSEIKIKIIKNGPYFINKDIPLYKEIMLSDKNENSFKFEKKKKISVDENYFLCRCGKSENKPFCDGNHRKINFEGKETSDKDIYTNSIRQFETEKIKLIDAVNLCDHSRFCLRNGGIRKLIENNDSESIKIAKEQASLCPSGRLLIEDKIKNETTEKDYEKEIVLIFDEGKNCEGPIWVKGGIAIEGADNSCYEHRNRVTLCRCGKSKIKPFCDGNHWMSPEF